MRYLAIDYGAKRTGLAVADDAHAIASPLEVIDSHSLRISRIIEVIKSQQIDALVIGLPLNMDGTEGKQSKTVRQFAKEIKKQIDIPIHFQDERLSSFDAEQKLAALGLTRKKKKKHLDAVAAAAILQSFLDEKQDRLS
jgi:putative holliday junction resolvase